MNDLISVVVPIYNVASYLPKCIISLINQTYKNIEIILVDDGSTDECPNICDLYATKDERIVVIHKENGGLSDARNVGIDKAKGKYICFVDSDDFIENNMLEELYKVISEDNSQIAICGRKEYFDYKDKYKKTYCTDNIRLSFDTFNAIKELCSFRYFDMSAWAKLYDISLFENIKFPVGKLSEDYYIMYLLFEKSKKVSFISNHLYIYRQRKGSISKNKKINYDYTYAALEQLNYLDKYPNLKKYTATAYALSKITIYDWYIKNRNSYPSKKETKELQTVVKKNLNYILDNELISYKRKIQAKLFCNCLFIYNLLFKMYNFMR